MEEEALDNKSFPICQFVVVQARSAVTVEGEMPRFRGVPSIM
jgi:hypothetical protein